MLKEAIPSPTDGVQLRTLHPGDAALRLLVIRDAPRAGECWTEIIEIGSKKGAHHGRHIVGE